MAKYKLKIIVLFISIIAIVSTMNSQHAIILETDFDGNVIKGSKGELISEIRKGKSIRIGWQLDFNNDKKPDFDHWSNAEFITILNGEVFTQIKNINLQIPNEEVPQIDIIPANTMWTGILGTNSILKNRFVYSDLVPEYDDQGKPIMTDKLEQELKIREVHTWKVATFWAVEQ